MKRREFITLVGGAALWCPIPVCAQTLDRMRRVGVLIASSDADWESQHRVAAFREGFQELGWFPGKSVTVEYRWGNGDADRVKAQAAELVARAPDVILCGTTVGAVELRRITRAIPMVFANIADPIGIGLIQSLASPGENITGFTAFEYAIVSKWLEILKELAPNVRRVALIFNPNTGPQGLGFLRSLQTVASSFGVAAVGLPFRNGAELDLAIDNFSRTSGEGGGLLVVPEAGAIAERLTIIAAAARNNLPAVYPLRYFTQDGGLAAYGVNNTDQWRRAASYVARILKGTRASELPVQAPVKFDLTFNLKTAKAANIVINPMILARADEVIE